MAHPEYLIFVVLLAVILDAAIIFWLRRIARQRGPDQRSEGKIVRFFGEYSPVLTWLKNTLLQRLMNALARLEEPDAIGGEPGAGTQPVSRRAQLELEFNFSTADRVSFIIEKRSVPLPSIAAAAPAEAAAQPAVSAELPRRFAAQQVSALARRLENKAARIAAWALLVIAAVLPALLVVRDRWLELPFSMPWLGGIWEQNVRSQGISLPVYFAVVLVCWLALPWLVLALGKPIDDPAVEMPAYPPEPAAISTRRKRAGAWGMAAAIVCALIVFAVEIASGQRYDALYLAAILIFLMAGCLRENRLASALQAARLHWKPVLVMAALHILLLLFLYHLYGDRQQIWLWGLLLAGALLAIWRSSLKLPVIYWLANFALVLYTFRIDGWEFSVIGDEFSFFTYAQELAHSPDRLAMLNKLFDGTAVYGSHPFFSSLIQALFAKIFAGSSNFGWRISNLYLAALSHVLLHQFFRQFLTKRVSLLAVSLLAPAHYLMTFGKIGYNNLQAFFAAALVLASGAWAVRRQSQLSLMVFGLAAGICFYVYPAALYILPVAALLMVFFDPPVSPPARRRWLLAGLSLALMILPLLVQADYWREKLPGTVLYQSDIVSSPGSLGGHFASNLLYAFLAYLFIPQESHFVVVSYVDAITGIFFLLGLCSLLWSGWKSRFWAFLLVSFLVLLLLVGASHGGRYPPTTRMFLLLPIWALIAALGVEWMLGQLRRLPLNPQYLQDWLPALVLLSVLGLNLYQAYVLSPRRSIGYQSPVMLFARILEHIRVHAADGPQNLVFAFLTAPPWGIDGYVLMARSYDTSSDQVRLEKITVTQNEIPADSIELLRSPHTMIIIYPDMDADVQSALVKPVQALGKLPCPVRTLSGVPRFSLWISPTMEWICAAGQ